jgi:hypothetical protein
VSILLPNLDELLAALPDATPADRDARALACAATGALTVEELDLALSTLAATWRQA